MPCPKMAYGYPHHALRGTTPSCFDGRVGGHAFGVLRRGVTVAALAAIVVGAWASAVPAAPGELDRSFGDGGTLLTHPGGRDSGWFTGGAGDIVVTPDGRLIVGVWADDNQPGGVQWSGLAAFRADGQPDGTFGENGIARGGSSPEALTVLPDGKILAAGRGVAVTRYLRSGAVDRSFGNGGYATAHARGSTRAVSVAPDGRIVVAGQVSREVGDAEKMVAARFLPDGRVDTSFGDGGFVLLDDRAPAHGLAILPGGKVLLGGSNLWCAEPGCSGVVRLNEDGSVDRSFGHEGDGIMRRELHRFVEDLAVQPDGRIVAVGYGQDGQARVIRLEADGRPDVSFGDGGMAAIAPVCSPEDCEAADVAAFEVVLDQRGNVVVAGSNRDGAYGGGRDQWIARLTPKGDLDRRFGEGGHTVVAHDSISSVGGLAAQRDGRLVIAGWSSWGFTALARFHVEGTAGLGNVIRGTSADDVLVGTVGDDVIYGLGGNDIIRGLGGNDVLIGGAGRDVLLGGRGADVMEGARGRDLLRGGPGADRLAGGAGRDVLRGEHGADDLRARDGWADRVFGGAGRDIARLDRHDRARGVERSR